MIAKQIPRWMRKARAKFAVEVGRMKGASYVATLSRFGDDAEDEAQQIQHHVGYGSRPSLALNSLVDDLRWWRAFERATLERENGK